ncbi:putative family 17 glucosidase SCW11 [Neolecta irregularis DAH-3]|uniref:Putative family 17 glucosidase SCW11 n=1 Tax=Neolecta irregularis (strain DAH-3) TaxID=1198029 RepID=A0A1U7LM90_NEOID|nr:putative family 17 glucosidase SCW11 [Neolecta irregularis DAH-3]|eukprot:OLL23759.1 putative family 17 glucosidase SCW11 [Neolecta irregularis DAH-3]
MRGILSCILLASTVLAKSHRHHYIRGSPHSFEETDITASASASVTVNPSSQRPTHPNDLWAIAYAPFDTNGSCKDHATIRADMASIKEVGFKAVRIYNLCDCDEQTSLTILPTTRELGLILIAGLWLEGDDGSSLTKGLSMLTSWGQEGNWDFLSMVVVGNEMISKGMNPQSLLAKVAEVKSQLTAAGYIGHVTIAETTASYVQYPELCQRSALDIVGANIHAYFTSTCSADNAGTEVKDQIRQISAICPGMEIVVLESGWPSAGGNNGLAIASAEAQVSAVKSLMNSGLNLCLFEFNNSVWKSNVAEIERSFGVMHSLAGKA